MRYMSWGLSILLTICWGCGNDSAEDNNGMAGASTSGTNEMNTGGVSTGGVSSGGVNMGGTGAEGCASVPICDGDSRCHFKEGVDGLNVECAQDNQGAWVLNVTSTGIPDHAYTDPMNEVSDQSFQFNIPLEPTVDQRRMSKPCVPQGEEDRSVFGIIGIAINGVAIYRPLSIDYVDPFFPPDGYDPERLDYCDAHGAVGVYHYHRLPICLYGAYHNGEMITGVVNRSPNLTVETSWERGDWPAKGGIIGFSLEGYPVYGPNADGEVHSGLDACNGKLDADGHYAYYVTTETFPYLIGCDGPGATVASTTDDDWWCTTQPPNR